MQHTFGSPVGLRVPHEGRRTPGKWGSAAAGQSVKCAVDARLCPCMLRALHFIRALAVNAENEVISILRSTLNLPSTRALTADTPLLGSVAELDSMAVVSILTALEERFGFAIDDDEVEGRTFESVGTLTRFVQDKLGA